MSAVCDCGRDLHDPTKQIRADLRQGPLHALQSGEIDLLSRNTTWPLARQLARRQLHRRTYYTAGFCEEVAQGESALELKQRFGCVQTGTTTERIRRLFRPTT